MSRPFVAVHEWVSLNDRETKDSCLVCKRRIEVITIKRCFGLGDGRFQRPEVSNAARTAGCFRDQQVKIHNLSEREVAHQTKRR
jgi:hypothetical protein